MLWVRWAQLQGISALAYLCFVDVFNNFRQSWYSFLFCTKLIEGVITLISHWNFIFPEMSWTVIVRLADFRFLLKDDWVCPHSRSREWTMLECLELFLLGFLFLFFLFLYFHIIDEWDAEHLEDQMEIWKSLDKPRSVKIFKVFLKSLSNLCDLFSQSKENLAAGKLFLNIILKKFGIVWIGLVEYVDHKKKHLEHYVCPLFVLLHLLNG